ncbi:amidohydrolase family protein [Georgenia sp. AZ-5]|uniref:amidohydrolase family protein n=1 Tax=Georgenia sp. AZ-5 TaxID=3367526 RepID=UPI00375429EE
MTSTPTPDAATGKPKLVVDGVLHAFNFTRENVLTPLADDILRNSYGGLALTGDNELIGPEDFLRNWTVEELAHLAFVESDIDVGVFHGVPWFDYFADGFVDNAKGIEMRRRWPNRVLFYGTVDPLRPDAVEQVEYLVREGGAIGIKLYPENWRHRENRVEPVLLDAPNLEPVVTKVLELGVPIAIHKAIPAGRGLTDLYKLGDVEQAALRYPDLQIEVVHSGAAFIEETAYIMLRYPNVWANLESTAIYAVRFKRRFAQMLGALMSSGAADRIIFASGSPVGHPQPMLEALYDFEMPQDLVGDYGYPPITPEVRAGILGLNFARLHGLDPDALRAGIADDEFARAKVAGRQPRWSGVTASLSRTQ